MAADITNTILDMIVQELPQIMNAEFEGMTDAQKNKEALYLRSVVKYPLQDDPTLRAFYLAVSPDTTMDKEDNHWRMPVTSIRRGKLGIHQEHPMPEIGGGYKYINFFLVRGWLPIQGSREAAHEIAGIGLRRLEQAVSQLMNGQMYQGLETDDGMESTRAGFPQVFNHDGAHYDIIGGESEWYPQLIMRFHVYTEIRREFYASPIGEIQ